jgi:hypothetical protein
MADHHLAPSGLFTLQRATVRAIDWDTLYELALADGHGCGAPPTANSSPPRPHGREILTSSNSDAIRSRGEPQ